MQVGLTLKGPESGRQRAERKGQEGHRPKPAHFLRFRFQSASVSVSLSLHRTFILLIVAPVCPSSPSSPPPSSFAAYIFDACIHPTCSLLPFRRRCLSPDISNRTVRRTSAFAHIRRIPSPRISSTPSTHCSHNSHPRSIEIQLTVSTPGLLSLSSPAVLFYSPREANAQ